MQCHMIDLSLDLTLSLALALTLALYLCVLEFLLGGHLGLVPD